jgi:hypothetical protein
MDALSRLSPLENRLIALGSAFALTLLFHALWCHNVAYPRGFEKHLKNGKPWVYIPIRWKGLRKSFALWVENGMLLLALALGIALVHELGSKHSPIALAVAFIVLSVALFRWNALWLSFRYRQQEDSYFHLHDSLKEKLASEGKDYTETAFRNLAAYQHHQLLRKADEGGHLTLTLKQQARLSREHRRILPSRETVES